MTSVQSNCCANTQSFITAPFEEGKRRRVLQACVPFPKGRSELSLGKNILHRVVHFISGLSLFIPLINSIILIALKRFSSTPVRPGISQPTNHPPQPICPVIEAPAPVPVIHNTPTPIPQTSQPAAIIVPVVGLPNFGRPKLHNICWMNSACQVFFRTPFVVETIVSKAALHNPPKMAVLLNELLTLIKRKADKEEIYDIQEQLIDFYKSKNHSFNIGTQHDPTTFVEIVMRSLDLEVSVTVSATVKREVSPNSFVTLSDKIRDLTMDILHASYQPGGASFADTIRKMPLLSNFKDKDRIIRIERILNKVPRILMIRMNAFQNRASANLPGTFDFSCIFNEKIRSQHKELHYKLMNGTHHYTCVSGGHYMAQQHAGGNHYNDLIVRALPVSAVFRNLLDSPFHLWEIEDPSLVGNQ